MMVNRSWNFVSPYILVNEILFFLENSVTSIGYNLFPLYFMFFMPNEINVLNK